MMEKSHIKILKILKEEYDKDPHGYPSIDIIKNLGISENELISSIKSLESKDLIKPLWGIGQNLPSNIAISEMGLDVLKERHPSNRIWAILSNPLMVALIAVIVSNPLTYYFTYQGNVASINYEKSLQENLKVILIDPKEVVAEPDTTYQFNNILFHNPTSLPISIQNFRYYASEGWFEQPEVNIVTSNISSDKVQGLPKLPEALDIDNPSIRFYMEIKPGEYKKMAGAFNLHTPKKKGDYSLQFCALVLEGKNLCSENLLVHLESNQTTLG